ncbi:Transposon Tf2-6 polyprotein [Cucumis melo var. makuwa]|uniref:Transposon Tf2-6 polyprotein n=1 Tax=Cucumis melo var. makuwa TaxID=1194695 RepID=A0A5D3DHI3_CUCMM|nr:Transposon Tf2-6 polyprotein [Cucumis melo var. makuwa]
MTFIGSTVGEVALHLHCFDGKMPVDHHCIEITGKKKWALTPLVTSDATKGRACSIGVWRASCGAKACASFNEGMFFGREKVVVEAAGRHQHIKLLESATNILEKTRAMAQKEWGDRLDMNEKEIRELKEMMLSLLKSMENLAEEVKEGSRAKLREELCASNGSGLKGKEKIGETEMTPGFTVGSSERSKYKKLEIPVFNGENPETWIYRAEHYFDINELADEEKVKVVVVSFGPDETPGEGSLGARLIRIKQDDGYDDCLKKFLKYSAPLPEIAKSVLIDAFITGLETNLQAEVKSRHPMTLEESVVGAQAQKGKQVTTNLENKDGKRPDFAMKQVAIPIKRNFVKREPPVKRLSDSEFRARLDKGLCFRCNDKYSSGHQCKGKTNRELMLFITNEEELGNEEEKEDDGAEGVELGSLEIEGGEVIILIDSGATHNFIHRGVVEELALPLERKNKFRVTIGDGTALEGNGICKKVEVKLPELTIVADFLMIELRSIDLVLGMQWLRIYGNPLAVYDHGVHGRNVASHIKRLTSGYHQIRMKEEDIEKTAFRTHEGHYEFLVMPFGLTNAPATFQSLMNQIFRPFLRRFVLVFFDDVLIYSKDIMEHEKHLGEVFNVMKDNRLFANEKKCVIGHSRVNYLGHWISKKGVEVDGEKVKTMVNWPQPTNVSELRGFLGLTGYYRSDDAMAAFESLKRAMISVPVLALLDFSLPFTIETDALGTGLGAVLSQNNGPIAYFSQKLSPQAQAKSIYERELMAVVMAVQKWRHYVLGRKFTILSDQKALKFLVEQRELRAELNSLSFHGLLDIETVTAEVEKDEELQGIINILKENPEGKANYQWESGGHSGFLRTYKRMNGEIHWMGMKNDVKKYVEQCEICQRNKTKALAPAGLLQPLPLPNLILEDWTMDFIEGLPKAGGYDSIMVVVDRLKMAHFITLKHPFTAKQVAEKFVEEIISKHGIPNQS